MIFQGDLLWLQKKIRFWIIERDSQRYASIFAQRIIDTIEIASEFPEEGRIVPEYKNTLLREKNSGRLSDCIPGWRNRN